MISLLTHLRLHNKVLPKLGSLKWQMFIVSELFGVEECQEFANNLAGYFWPGISHWLHSRNRGGKTFLLPSMSWIFESEMNWQGRLTRKKYIYYYKCIRCIRASRERKWIPQISEIQRLDTSRSTRGDKGFLRKMSGPLEEQKRVYDKVWAWAKFMCLGMRFLGREVMTVTSPGRSIFSQIRETQRKPLPALAAPQVPSIWRYQPVSWHIWGGISWTPPSARTWIP